MKKCQLEKCPYNVFSKGYCKIHQYLRTDPKKPKSTPKKVSDKELKRKQGITEMDIFKEIWTERPHISELSGLPLPYKPNNVSQWVKQFLHVLNKGRFPSLRLDKRNIMLGTPDEHDHQDRFENFEQRKIELLAEVYKK